MLRLGESGVRKADVRKDDLIWCIGVGHSRLQTEPGQSSELQHASLTVLPCSHLYN